MAASQTDITVKCWWWWHQQWRSKLFHQSMTKNTNSYAHNNIASPLTGCTVVFNNGARSMLVLISPFPVGSPAYTRTHRRGFWVILFNGKEEQIRQALSPPQRTLCVVRGLGRGKKESARGTMGREKRERETPIFSLLPSFLGRLLFFDHCFFYWDTGLQWKPASAEERETNPIVDLDNNCRLV